MASAQPIRFQGRVATGQGIAVGFTGAAWARDGFMRLVGIDPHPGTLNLILPDDAARAAWAKLRTRPGRHLPAPDGDNCDARLYPVTVGDGIAAAIVLPEVAGYPPEQVELIASVRLRDALGVGDGDAVWITAAGEAQRE